jgi:hypothetical protein
MLLCRAPGTIVHMTLIWFLIWLVANTIGAGESLTFDPVNGWAGTFLLAAAVDLARQHATELSRSSDRR